MKVRRHFTQMLIQQRGGGSLGEGMPTGQYLVKHHAEHIDVSLRCDRFAANLFWGDVCRGADHRVFRGNILPSTQVFGDAKVTQISVAVFIQ